MRLPLSFSRTPLCEIGEIRIPRHRDPPCSGKKKGAPPPECGLSVSRRAQGAAGASPDQRALGRAAVTAVEATARICRGGEVGDVKVTKRREPKLWRALKKRPEDVDALLRGDS